MDARNNMPGNEILLPTCARRRSYSAHGKSWSCREKALYATKMTAAPPVIVDSGVEPKSEVII